MVAGLSHTGGGTVSLVPSLLTHLTVLRFLQAEAAGVDLALCLRIDLNELITLGVSAGLGGLWGTLFNVGGKARVRTEANASSDLCHPCAGCPLSSTARARSQLLTPPGKISQQPSSSTSSGSQ